MAQTAAEAAQLAQVSKKFEDGAAGLQKMLTDLMGRLEVTQTAWQGRAGRSFGEVKRAWEADQRTLVRALTDTSAAIATAGKTFDSTDDEAVSRITKLNTSGPSMSGL
jgi:WXG100 family type VII secretion target